MNHLEKPPESFSDDLSTVHNALQDAVLESKARSPMQNYSVRLPINLKLQADEILHRHGTDLSSFLRHCASRLVSDYGQNPEG